ncbi:6-phosphofructokinase [Mangrovivirga cuniculi]|uniref:ATP-dependent 6-phosphofructokinase n=1 Tax=Mangrovivirga cuniculi TaxID=2715131 RepID=A0A4D7JPS0_9BACT|nr:6-phosphofructokinase [Mangrovivirga cuniculi]QCK14792.1 6-phosphofructokinase [Mangrovivirga cuniculi]
MKKIGVFTSGGDAPGMNAALRAVVRGCIYYGIEVYGIRYGYKGMIEGDIIPLNSHSVSNIIQRAGTVLKSARCQEFREPEGRKKAFDNLKKFGIDALIAIGGDGTFTGAKVFFEEHAIPVIGIPGTIDNDIYGTDKTIGFDTAVNTALSAVDNIRDTADSHDRVFFIEVMGRDSGYIAIQSGIGGGAEMVMVPETKTTINEVIEALQKGWSRSKTSSIVVIAEGDEEGNAFEISEKVKARVKDLKDIRVTILGHVQRGGTPTAQDRILASRLGLSAVEGLRDGKSGVMVGVINDEVTFTSFGDSITKQKPLNKDLIRMVEILSI